MAEPEATDDFELPWRRRSSTPGELALHLVIVWSLEEPERVGQAAQVVEGASLGRGEPEAGDTARLQLTAQAHLLRVMDQGDYQRLGEATQRRSDFRLIAATNREPSALKHDFAARFPLRVRLPGLNERLEDVPLLLRRILLALCAASEGLVDRFFERRKGAVAEPRVEPELVEWLLRHRYTTHVRELERLLWIAISTSPDDFIAATPEFVREVAQNPELEVPEPDRAAIEQALTSARGNVTKAARLLGLRNRYVLYRLMKKVGLEAAGD